MTLLQLDAEAEDLDRVPTVDEKMQLSYEIFRISNHELARVLTMIEEKCPSALLRNHSADEVYLCKLQESIVYSIIVASLKFLLNKLNAVVILNRMYCMYVCMYLPFRLEETIQRTTQSSSLKKNYVYVCVLL